MTSLIRITLQTTLLLTLVHSSANAIECEDMFQSSPTRVGLGIQKKPVELGRLVWKRFQIRRYRDDHTDQKVLVRSGIFESTEGPTKGLKVAFDFSRQALHGATRPSVILLHGVFNRREDLLKVSQEFERRGWNVLAVDLLGHGQTAILNQQNKQTAIGHKIQVETLASLIEQLHAKVGIGLNQPLVVGHSLGGGLSMPLAKELKARGIRPIANVPVTPYLSSIDKFLLHHGFTPDVMSYFNDRLIEKLGLRHSDKNQSSYFDFWRNFFRVLYEPALLALDSPQFRPVADFFQSLNDPLSSRFLEKAYRRYHELKSASDLASLKISEAELDVLIQGAMAATKGVRSLDFQARHGATKLDPTIPTLVISADRDQVVIPPQIRDFKDVAETFGYDVTFVELKGDHHLPQRHPVELTDAIFTYLAERNLLPQNLEMKRRTKQ